MTQHKKPNRPKRLNNSGSKSGKATFKPQRNKEAQEAVPLIAEGRIAKILARAGVASRREVERMIEEGRVKLNGKVLTSPAINVSGTENIEVDDKPIAKIERTRLWLYHKPQGLVTTNHDPEGRDTVFDNLPDDLPRVMSVGRLDINTEGLLLLTNDGGLARTLELPSTGWLRRYRVRAHGKIDQDKLDSLKDGIAVDGVLYGAIEATLDRTQGANQWITMGLREGKNREIKVVLGALGLEVNRLIRLSYGPFQLGELAQGKAVEVRGRLLRDQLGTRLVAESGANFDAPLRDHEKKEERDKAAEWKPRRKLTEMERKERARARISTSKDEADLRSKKDEKFGKTDKFAHDDARPRRQGPRDRSVNVWMGKGARPTVEKKDDLEVLGRAPKQGNWHRPKDKLDPQTRFRRPKHELETDEKGPEKGKKYASKGPKRAPNRPKNDQNRAQNRSISGGKSRKNNEKTGPKNR